MTTKTRSKSTDSAHGEKQASVIQSAKTKQAAEQTFSRLIRRIDDNLGTARRYADEAKKRLG